MAQSTQIAGDSSVGTLVNGNLAAPCTGGTCVITGGTQAGTSLFHSFDQFSLQSGDEARFSHTGIDTIFTRVTGSDSFIDGTLSTTTPTDLFLLNPQGILFGPNAVLNIGGSFLATTADAIVFDNNVTFSASTPTSLGGLLSISTPIGLQYGSNPGPIEVQGPGHQITPFFTTEFIRTNRPNGLQVTNGETLALLGGPLTFDGANLTASGGHVELAGIGENGVVDLSTTGAWAFDYAQVPNLEDISLINATSVDVSAANGGSVGVQAQNLSLSDGSVIAANLQGAGTSNGLNINADSLLIQGSSGGINSGLYSDAEFPGTGQGGNIDIQTQHLEILDFGRISAITYGSANAGNIQVQTDQLTMAGESFIVSSAYPFVSGSTGNVQVAANTINLSGGAQLATSNFGFGSTGQILVDANQIVLTGTSTNGQLQSGFEAIGFLGAGGEIVVNADQVQILDGGQITANTFGPASGGQVTITANRLAAVGTAAVGDAPSGVSTGVLPSPPGIGASATGDGGNLTLIVDQLYLADGANIAVGTFAEGDAGDMTIQANTIELTGLSPAGRTGLFASNILGTGDGGNIDVDAGQITISDGATISASSFQSLGLIPPGQGAPGNIQIKADNLALNNDASIAADTIAVNHTLGNILLDLDTLTLQQGSRISTNAQESSTGGNIVIDAIALIATGNSDISANAQQGIGGRIIVNANLILGTDFRPQLTAESDITASSELGPTFSGSVELNTPEYGSDQGLTALPTTPVDNAQQIARQCTSGGNSLVISGRGGVATNPNEVLRNDSIWTDFRLLSDPTSELENSKAPVPTAPVPLTSEYTPNPNGSIVEAQDVSMENGQIRLVAAASNSPSAIGATVGCQQ
ncbi:two-partner secretion domain-containing protein [Leptothoe sp. PORK10 BA2]|uniref:two-partner secretion domain-containing protein n=1 Tax=Leptothoe sp. PORK10 BA2 TaxID=3110254 RepID=UPI002B1F0ED9|nr:filamentous hemagglutinin N-terminal domain-containing protein [Leptothoe sp. PORK10 BA2]MEA5466238.1 filamentous hemagglutinin N-terminal domain-containing protein [Leptothoe sp. PORK10 BA2]